MPNKIKQVWVSKYHEVSPKESRQAMAKNKPMDFGVSNNCEVWSSTSARHGKLRQHFIAASISSSQVKKHCRAHGNNIPRLNKNVRGAHPSSTTTKKNYLHPSSRQQEVFRALGLMVPVRIKRSMICRSQLMTFTSSIMLGPLKKGVFSIIAMVFLQSFGNKEKNTFWCSTRFSCTKKN